MRFPARRLRILFALLSTASLAVVASVAACSSPEPSKGNDLSTRNEDSGTGKTKDTGGGTETPDDGPPKPEEDPPLPDGGKPPGKVYGHTASTLYLYDPLAKSLTKIGAFACLDPGDRVLDLAIDKIGNMYATSDVGFLKVNAIDATCNYQKRDLRYPNSLTFVPLGTVDPTKETLVGYQFEVGVSKATIYVSIDVDTGDVTKVGDLNPANAAIKYRSSGDMIALIRNGNKAYLTVKTYDVDAGNGNDFLAEIDPANGKIKSILGDTKVKDLFGLGQWAGTAYGFSGNGDMVEINMSNGTSTKVLTLKEDGGTVPWFGAGVTTDSPTKP